MKSIRADEHRTFFQKWITDPLSGLGILLFLGVFKLMPLDVASWCGAGLGGFFGLVCRKKNKIALHNLRKCFPEKTDAWRKDVIRKMWRHFGRVMGEIPHYQKIVDSRLELEGAEYLVEAKNDGKGAFFCSAHFGNWEFYGLLTLKFGFPLHLVYRAANNPWAEKFLYQKRQTNGATLIPKGIAGARQLIELLKKNEHIGILFDQKFREGIDVPFFGYPAKTAHAMATMAIRFGVPVFPTHSFRKKGASYKVVVGKPLAVAKQDDKEKAYFDIMLEANRLLEDWIRANPEQWLWIHRRWDKSEYR